MSLSYTYAYIATHSPIKMNFVNDLTYDYIFGYTYYYDSYYGSTATIYQLVIKNSGYAYVTEILLDVFALVGTNSTYCLDAYQSTSSVATVLLYDTK